MAIQSAQIPREFILRRIHSLMGFWFLLFLMEHLFTNSQIALFFTNQELWFVRSVDFLGNLPYLHVIEVVLIGVPIAYHAILGVVYLFTGKSNVFHSNGNTTSIQTGRNWSYTLQRMSAWILLGGIVLHVVQMRFLDYPYKYQNNYYARMASDAELPTIANRLGVQIYDQKAIEEIKLVASDSGHIRGLESRPLRKGEVMCVSRSFGNIELLNVRDTFRSPMMCLFYSIFVLAAVFHGFNGLWTFLITWGLLLSGKSQSQGAKLCIGLMFLLGVLGFMSIWGTYFLG